MKDILKAIGSLVAVAVVVATVFYVVCSAFGSSESGSGDSGDAASGECAGRNPFQAGRLRPSDFR